MTGNDNLKEARMRSPHTIKKNGFTLIELLVVIVIVGLLTSVATISYTTAQRKARDNARKTQVNTIAAAIESYYQQNRTFPGKLKAKSTVTANVLPANNRCENVDTSSDSNGYSYFYYYYYPFDLVDPTLNTINKPCDTRPVNNYGDSDASNDFDPSVFSPSPNWIPGLGSYLNPAPVDKKYQGKDGNQPNTAGNVGDYDELLKASDDIANNNFTRTLGYRRLDNGYAVFTRMESADSGANSPTITDSTRPIWPSYIRLSTNNIYMISR